MFFRNEQEKEEFYSVAIKSRIQLLWMQDLAMRIALWLALIINLTASTMFFIAWLTSGNHDQFIPQTAPLIVVISALFPFFLFFVGAIYPAGLLIYRWRVRRAVRRQSTIVPMYEMTIDPVETAALIGRSGFRAEAWYLIHRLVSTGHIRAVQDDDGTVSLERANNQTAKEELKWYERQLLDDFFVSEEQRKQQLLRSMSPARLAALEGIDYGTRISLDRFYKTISGSYASSLNQQIRDRLIRDGLFNRLGGVGMWVHTFLYSVMFGVPIFAVLFTHGMLVTIPWQDAVLWISLEATMIAAILYVAFFVCAMIWFLRTDIYTRFGLGRYVEAEGLYAYLSAAMQDRLENDGLSQEEMAYYMPYAHVMGLVAVNDQDEISRLMAAAKL